MTQSFIAAAEQYVRAGWHILPLHPRSKVPAAARGVHDASDDVERVRRHWRRNPHDNIGVACGRSGLIVVDLDGDAGEQTMRRLLEHHDPLRRLPALWAQTGKGWHAYWSRPDSLEALGPSVGLLGDGVDVRAGASYVCAPPSRHPDGGRYQWITRWTPRPPEPPPWPVAMLESTMTVVTVPRPRGPQIDHHDRYVYTAMHAELRRVLDAPRGARNATLFDATFTVSRLLERGLPPRPARARDGLCRGH